MQQKKINVEEDVKQKSDAMREFLTNLQDYARKQKDLEKSIKFYNEDIILLEKLAQGGQGEVQVGYNKKTNQMLVIKQFSDKHKTDYQRERDMYKHLKQCGCDDLVLGLIENDDDRNILVMERGMCDLKKFVQLRNEEGNIDGPITVIEVFLIIEYVANAMQRLWREAGLCLCDTKEYNILIAYSNQGLGGYKPVLTDLGGAYCRQVQSEANYPVAHTPIYFDPCTQESITFLRQQYNQYNNVLDDIQIIQSEIYTLGRMIQSLLLYCLQKTEKQYLNILKELFKQKFEVIRYLDLFEEIIYKSNNNYQSFISISQLIRNMLVERKYKNFETLVKDIQAAKVLVIQMLGKKEQTIEFLADSQDSVRQWQKQMIAKKSNFDQMPIDELKILSEYYHEYNIFNNSVVVNQILLQRLEKDLNIRQIEFLEQMEDEVKQTLSLKSQTLRYLAEALEETGNVEKALECNQQELHIRSDLLFQRDSKQIADCYEKIGKNNMTLGFIDKALDILQISLKTKIKIYGENHFNLTDTYRNIGQVYRQKGRLQQALEMYMKSLNTEKAYYGDKNFILARTYGNIGNVYSDQGNLEQALEMQIKCLNIMKAHYCENNFNLAITYRNIGEIYRQYGKLEQALEIQMKCLHIMKAHYGENNFNLGGTYGNIGIVYEEQGNLEQAMHMFMKCFNIMKAHYGDNNFNLANAYNNIGGVYLQEGNLEQGLEMFMKCLKIQESHYENNNFNLAKTYNNIGNTYREQGNLEQALQMYIKCLNIMKVHYGDDNFNLVGAYNNIGQVYKDQKKLEQALEMYMKCLNIQNAHYGDNNFNLASTYNNIGEVYSEQNNLEQALEMYMKCLKIQKIHYGDNNFNLAITYRNIGKVYNKNQEKLEQALEMYMKCLNIQKTHYRDNNFNLADTYICIGNLYSDQGNLEQALEIFMKCLNLQKAHYSDKNFKLANTYLNIGCVYGKHDNLEQALEMFIKCLNIQKAHYGDNNFNLAITYMNIDSVNGKKDNLEQALEMFIKCLNIQKAHYGENNFDLASTYNNIGKVYRQKGNLEQALEMFMKCLNIEKLHYGDKNFNLASTYQNIGNVYREQRNLELALEMYMKSLNIEKVHYDDNNFNLASTYENIGSIYYDQGNLEQALEMYMKSLNIESAHYGDNNLNLASTYGNIGNVYREYGNLEQALEMYMKCLMIMKAHYGENNLNLGFTYHNLSLLFEKMKNVQISLEMSQKAYNIFSNHYGQNHQYTKMVKQQSQRLQSIILLSKFQGSDQILTEIKKSQPPKAQTSINFYQLTIKIINQMINLTTTSLKRNQQLEAIIYDNLQFNLLQDQDSINQKQYFKAYKSEIFPCQEYIIYKEKQKINQKCFEMIIIINQKLSNKLQITEKQIEDISLLIKSCNSHSIEQFQARISNLLFENIFQQWPIELWTPFIDIMLVFSCQKKLNFLLDFNKDQLIFDKFLDFIEKIVTESTKIPLIKATLQILKNLFQDSSLIQHQLDKFFNKFFEWTTYQINIKYACYPDISLLVSETFMNFTIQLTLIQQDQNSMIGEDLIIQIFQSIIEQLKLADKLGYNIETYFTYLAALRNLALAFNTQLGQLYIDDIYLIMTQNIFQEERRIRQCFDDIISIFIYGDFFKYKDLSFYDITNRIKKILIAQREQKRNEIIDLLKQIQYFEEGFCQNIGKQIQDNELDDLTTDQIFESIIEKNGNF